MAKRELSSTLRNLKFMQRAGQREEKSKGEEEFVLDGNFPSSGSHQRKCLVIVEGDPHPGAIKGRMSFHNFNPSIDKLNEEATNLSKPEASATCAGNQDERNSHRENWPTQNLSDNSKLNSLNNDANGEVKRMQAEVVSETQYPSKSQKKVQVYQESSPSHSRSSQKQLKREKTDWSVLRPPKGQKKGE